MSITVNMKYHSFDIVIQGAGPVGIVAALLAEQKGLSVLLIESQQANSYRGNAHYLNAYSLEILHACGIDILALRQKACDNNYAYSMSYGVNLDQCLYHINLMDDQSLKQRYQKIGQFGGALNIPLSLLYQQLLNRVEQTNITIVWNTTITELDSENKIILLQTSQTQLQQNTVHYHYLLACDGSNSGIRSLLSLPSHPHYWQQFVNIEIKANLKSYIEKPALLNWIIHPQYPACVVLHSLDQLQNIQVPILHYPAEQFCDHENFQKNYINHCIGSNDIDYQVLSVQPWKMQTFVMQSFIEKDHIFFVGDSAHNCTPAGGLGLNTGLHDAANLIWKLSPLENSSSFLIQSYQTERKFIADSVTQKSIENYHDFQSATSFFGLPKKGYELVKDNALFNQLMTSSPWCNFTSKLYQFTASCFFSTFQKKAFYQHLQNTLQHFDGMNYHIGFNYYDHTFSIGNIYTSDHHPILQYYKVGSLWFNQHLYSKKQPRKLLEFSLGRWTVINLSITEHQFFSANQVQILHFDEDFEFEDKTIHPNTLIILRPDRIIFFMGTIDQWNQQYYPNPFFNTVIALPNEN